MLGGLKQGRGTETGTGPNRDAASFPMFYHGNRSSLGIGIVGLTVGQNIGDRMAHRLADAQLSLRAAGGGTFLLVMAGHSQNPN